MRAALWPCSKDCSIVRDLLLFLAFAAILPFIFRRPVVGALAYAVVSLGNPHRLAYGFAADFPFAMWLCIATLIAVLFTKERRQIPMSPPVVLLVLFSLWLTLTTIFARVPDAAWLDWNRVSKILLMIFVTILTVRTRKDVQALALVVALALGFWGAKSGLFVLVSGGGEGLRGPRDSFISDNNTLALAMITACPLIIALMTRAPAGWLRKAVLGIAVLTGLAAIGSYSRGALVGICMMVFFLWLKSSYKFKTGLLLALLLPLALAFMPEQWMGRMESIGNYEEDASATGRINSWRFAINIANTFPLGGGPNVFTPHMFMLYAPEPERYYDAHSIYFQVLGEQGYVGLALFLLLFFVAWRCASRVIRHCQGQQDLQWASMLARMCQVSIIGYMTAGAFLTLAYYDLIYYVIAIIITLDKVLIRSPQPDDIPPIALPWLRKFTRTGAAQVAQRPPA